MVDRAGDARMRFQGFRATLVATWPRVPWSLLQYGAPAAMVLAPIALYPFSKLAWLAFDLMLRPVVPNDLAAPPSPR